MACELCGIKDDIIYRCQGCDIYICDKCKYHVKCEKNYRDSISITRCKTCYGAIRQCLKDLLNIDLGE